MTGITFRPIGELVEPVGTWNPIRDESDTFLYVDLSAVDQDLKQITKAREVICAEAPSRARQLVRAGDILVSTVRPNLNGVAKVPSELDSATASTGFCVLRPNTSLLESSFLFHWVKSPQFVSDMVSKATGASYPAVSDKIIMASHMPFVSVTEQRGIAAILDQADTLRAKRREALAQLDSLTQSIFIEMFGDPVANPKGWERTPIQEVCGTSDDIKCGPFGTQLSKSEVTEEGVPLWGIKNVNAAFRLPAFEFLRTGTANRLKAYDLISGDIVMTRKGTIGNCAVYPDDFPNGVMHSDLLRIRPNFKKCLPVFLSHQLHHSKDIERQLALISGGAVMPGINVTKLKTIEVLVPAIELQQKFLVRSGAVDDIRKNEGYAMLGLTRLFSSLQHRAFRGEL